MKKKFKCRHSFYYGKSYTIEYCSYYLFPMFYKELMSSQFKNFPELFSKEQAEYFCKKSKSIIDIQIFNIDVFLEQFVKDNN